jgi:PIN domain nuclease of toxin-antitoxin system
MKVLLDTHAFMWWVSEPENLTPRVNALCRDPQNTVILSVASVWEIQVKHQLGKLDLTAPLLQLIEIQQRQNNLQILPITFVHVMDLDQLPLIHRDPFDRILIAQARVEQAVIVSRDRIFLDYPVTVEW